MNFNTTNEFEKDFKKLLKKFRSLNNDLLEFKKVITKFPKGIGKHFSPLIRTEKIVIVKARFFCQSLKRKNLRIIYSYYQQERSIEFIEIYFKGNKENEDRARIKNYLKDSELKNIIS